VPRDANIIAELGIAGLDGHVGHLDSKMAITVGVSESCGPEWDIKDLPGRGNLIWQWSRQKHSRKQGNKQTTGEQTKVM